MERCLTYGFLLLFGILTIVLFTLHYPAGSFDLGGFKLVPFLVQFSVVAGYQISWAIYVSDYSRYLPPDVTVSKTFYWTYGGSGLGAVWIMCIGAALASWAGKSFDGSGIAELLSAGNKVFDGFGDIILIFSALGLVSVMALNMYGGSLTLLSAFDSFKRVRPTLNVRLVTITLTALLSRRRRTGQHRVVPVELRELPAAGALLLHPVDRGQPGRLLHRAARALRDRGDLQARRHLRSLGLARDHLLPRRLRGDGAVLQHRHRLRGLGRPRREGRRLLAVRRACPSPASSTGC